MDLEYDALPATNQELSFKLWETDLQKVVGIGVLHGDLLKTLGLLNKEGYTCAAQLFSNTPGLPQASLEIARFEDISPIFLHRESVANCSVLHH
ncbi:MAG: hypothetical protein PHO72_08755 [Sphaerochaeta sp.]|nr:hypothetical protein [uncultured Sphaerochaeta sp.]MDD3058398.1 hypothetical protein [Sphaerochaeta sp.]